MPECLSPGAKIYVVWKCISISIKFKFSWWDLAWESVSVGSRASIVQTGLEVFGTFRCLSILKDLCFKKSSLLPYLIL